MKLTTIIAACAVAFTALPAAAQQAGAISGSQSGSAAQSGSIAALTINNMGGKETRPTGTTTTRIENAPDVMAPSLGSGHPCMINTSVGISVIGGGASGGRGEVDYGCMMMRSNSSVDNQAGRVYYASKDPAACKAWRSVGAIAANSLCDEKERRAAKRNEPTVSSRNAPSVGYSKCYKKADNTVGIRYKAGVDKVAAQAACLSSLGY